MKHVYILTEEGRDYTKEGCLYITDVLKKKCNETDRLMFHTGLLYNDPKELDKDLEMHPDCYVVISLTTGMPILYGENIQGLRNALHDFPNQTSWRTAYETLKAQNLAE